MSEEVVRTTLYIKKATHEAFKEIIRREHKSNDKVSMSSKTEEFMESYNKAHSRGNPQLTISTYAKPEEPQPMKVLCLFIDGALSDGQIHCRRAGSWVPGVRCYSCEKNQLRKG